MTLKELNKLAFSCGFTEDTEICIFCDPAKQSSGIRHIYYKPYKACREMMVLLCGESKER
jgi:hypothetical protein